MYKNIAKVCPFTYGFLGFEWKIATEDRVYMDKSTMEQYQAWKKEQNPFDRVKQMYTLDEYGNISPEFNSIKQAGFLGLFAGAIIGGTVDSRIAYINFMERNQASAFENHFEAKKVLQDSVTKGFARGAWKWSWRLGLFTTSFTAISTTISAYRGKTSLWEYMAAGGFSGALYKFNMGLKGMAAGAIVGSAMGAVAGLPIVGLLALTGLSMEEVRYWQYSWKLSRSKLEQEAFAHDMGIKPTPLEIDHELRVGKDRLSLDVVDQQSNAKNTNASILEKSTKTQATAKT